MKKIFSIMALSAGLLGLASCSDFLDQDSPSDMSSTTVYNSTYYTSLRVNKIYGGLGQDRTYSQDFITKANINSDIELVDGLGNDAYLSNERGVCNYNFSAGWSTIADEWTAMYGIIEDANDVIEGVRTSPLFDKNNSSYEEMARYLGEALTLRAMVYFDMLRYWGDIPLKLETSNPDLSNAFMAKTDRDVIMDTLMTDLDEAINYLPWAGEDGYTTEHVTKGYAHALLAQIAMTRAGYVIREKAKDGYETASYSDAVYPTQRPGAAERKALYERALSHLTAVIKSGKHQLNPSFENEWYQLNQQVLDQTYQENLFEIPLKYNLTSELGYTVGVRLNGVTTDYGYGNSSGKVKLTAPLFYSYDSNDTRRDVTVAPYEIKEDQNVTRESMLSNAPFGLYVGKWDPRKMNSTWLDDNIKASGKHMTGINPVKMRYSNVLLFYSECMNELAGSPDASYPGDAGMTARQALALVHERAFDSEHKSEAAAYVASLPSDKDGFFNEGIVQENAWEFAGEGFRKWDLIRWNLLVEKIYEFKQTYLQELADGTYPDKIFYNYSDEAKKKIDMSSVTWYTPSEMVNEADYAASVSWFGNSKLDTGTDKQVDTNLPSISSGLVGTDVNSKDAGVAVKNRYLMPIGLTTISDSQGYLSNSYGY
ncbi:RagB/SusD family nutrient uptake outer membrane protein [Prevotella sp.]|uniref:RagB/SusD family nutrient uptake outer membrane protein n=1 Tax=Prevotella sp. TaxID=59823 RepID=UPI003AB3A43E